MDGLGRSADENQPLCDETSSFGVIFYIKRPGVVYPFVNEMKSIIWTCNLFLWITQTWQELFTAFTKYLT